MHALAKVKAVVGEDAPVRVAIGQPGRGHICDHGMANNGEILALEFGQTCYLQIQLLPAQNCVLALLQLGVCQPIAHQAMAANAMHQIALQRHALQLAHREQDVGHRYQIDEQPGHIVAEQSKRQAQIARMPLEQRPLIRPVAHVGADVIAAHEHGEQLPVSQHVHLGIALQQIDQHARLI